VGLFGTTDIRVYLASRTWGVGLGPLASLRANLELEVADAGGDWALDWDPYVMGNWVSTDGEVAVEAGYAFGYATTCATVDRVGVLRTPVAAQTDVAARAVYESTGTVKLDLLAL
jgi:hypothetical protein